MDRATVTEFQQADGVRDWRALDAGASAWFDAPSMTAGAALVHRIGELTAATGLPDVDLRPGGVRVRIGPAGDLTRADVHWRQQRWKWRGTCNGRTTACARSCRLRSARLRVISHA